MKAGKGRGEGIWKEEEKRKGKTSFPFSGDLEIVPTKREGNKKRKGEGRLC